MRLRKCWLVKIWMRFEDEVGLCFYSFGYCNEVYFITYSLNKYHIVWRILFFLPGLFVSHFYGL